ncbi:MAG: hypothetical protein AAFQ75_05720 [Pseudomonadota bacterium]
MFDQAMTDIPATSEKPKALSAGMTGQIDPVRLKRLKDQEYRTMYWLIVPVCLVIAAIARVARALGFGGDAFHSSHEIARGSLAAEASRMAHTVIPFAFWR